MCLACYISAALGCVCQVLPRDVLVVPLHLLPAVTRSVSRWEFTRAPSRLRELRGSRLCLEKFCFLPTLPSRIDADLSSRVSRSRKTDWMLFTSKNWYWLMFTGKDTYKPRICFNVSGALQLNLRGEVCHTFTASSYVYMQMSFAGNWLQ